MRKISANSKLREYYHSNANHHDSFCQLKSANVALTTVLEMMIIFWCKAAYQTLNKAGLAGMEGKGCCNFVLILILYRSCQSKETLYIGGLFGLDTTRGGWSSAGIIPAVQMAIDHINNSSEYLKDYHLELLIKDSQVRMNLLVKKKLIILELTMV